MTTHHDNTPDNQQPINHTAGNRRVRRLGDGMPSEAERDAMDLLSNYRTCVPKGVFIYHNHQEMDDDRIRWTVDKMVEVARSRKQ